LGCHRDNCAGFGCDSGLSLCGFEQSAFNFILGSKAFKLQNFLYTYKR
jgi:hypothetical protein